MTSKYLDPDNLIVLSKANEAKIYIREQFGFFQKLRRYLSTILMLFFVVIPLIRFQGHQAVLFDVEQQTLQLFSFVLFPQDMVIFSLLFAFAAFALFYISSLYGRVWCGFACPQTIWMLMFNWVERRIEGSANKSKQLDKANWGMRKLAIKVVKHSIWLLISLLTSLVFISYFVPVEELYLEFFTFKSSPIIVGWVLFFMVCTYLNAGWIKEKMCQHMCPYSRFQSSMFNDATKLITYNQTRGESRGKRKRNIVKPNELGDCVDCNLCVEVCPVGIDIRDGLQYDCIHCGLCIDACNQTMEKFGYQNNLISFSNKVAVSTKHHVSYIVTLALLAMSMGVWAVNWQSLEVNVIRDRNALFRIDHQGNVENTYVVKIRNKAPFAQNILIEANNSDTFTLDKTYQVSIAPKELAIIPVVAILSDSSANGVRKLTLTIVASNTGDVVDKQVSFYVGR
ncbi:cytochrome c oxidase accessory protein CcoG [Thalassotalea ganghwensis]